MKKYRGSPHVPLSQFLTFVDLPEAGSVKFVSKSNMGI